MIKREVKIEGISYRVGSTTERGLEEAIASLKKSLETNKKQDEENGI